VTALALDAPGREGWTQLGHLLARLAVLGLPVRLGAWFQGRDLPQGTVAECLARAKAQNTPKPTDWTLSPNRAEPVTPLPPRKPLQPPMALTAVAKVPLPTSTANVPADMILNSTSKWKEATITMSRRLCPPSYRLPANWPGCPPSPPETAARRAARCPLAL
jgi:hypothetical protein